jgi:hypothetical protein
MFNKKFRNFNVTAKATALQKENYRKNAKKEGLSLSEWIVTVLDLHLDQNNIKIKKEKSINGFILGFFIGATFGIIVLYLVHKGLIIK